MQKVCVRWPVPTQFRVTASGARATTTTAVDRSTRVCPAECSEADRRRLNRRKIQFMCICLVLLVGQSANQLAFEKYDIPTWFFWT